MIKKINKILVACDCSDFSGQIFSYAVEIGHGLGVELTVVNVINQIELDRISRALDSFEGKTIEDHVTALKEDRKALIHKLIQDTQKPKLFKKTIIKIGTHHAELMNCIEHEKADLLIIGNKGHGNLAGILMGSCAEKLFRHCPVTMLMVKVSEQAQRV